MTNQCPICHFPLAIGEADEYDGLCRLCFEREWEAVFAEDDRIRREAHEATGEPMTECVMEGDRIVMRVAQ